MKKSSEVADRLVREICYFGNGDVYKDATKGRFILVIREQVKEALEQAYTIADMLPCETPEKVRVAATIAQAIRKLIEEIE